MECICKNNCEFDNLIDKLINDFRGVNSFWLLIFCLIFILCNISRALRWNQLIEPLGYKPKVFNTFFAIMIGYLINLAIPRGGEIAKPATITKYEKIPLEKLVGTIVIDRVFDLIMLFILIGLTFLTQYHQLYNFLFGHGTPSIECVTPIPSEASFFPWRTIFWITFSLAGFFFIIFAIKWKTFKKSKIASKFRVLILSFISGLKTVSQLKNPFLFFFHTLFIWALYYLMIYICFFSFLPTSELPPLAALLTFTFGTFAIIIPSPGGMGTYQIATTAALVIYNVPEADAFAFSNIIFFTTSLFCYLFLGLLAYAILPFYNKNYTPVKQV
jgi:glycosyltransferase 2 family protein